MGIKSLAFDYFKNILGWKTDRKLIVFSVDDYGNCRLDSKTAYSNLISKGFKANSRFDRYDSLETTQDLEMLFDTLSSVKDKNGNHPKFTCYSLPCNLNFEAILESNFNNYYYELLPETFEKLSCRYQKEYSQTWDLWKQGMNSNLLVPEFHGREHLNYAEYKYQLANNFDSIKLLFENRSYSFLPEATGNRMYTAAFSFNKKEETESFSEIISTGIIAFEKTFSKSPSVFTPPAQQFPPFLEASLKGYGLRAIDRPFFTKVHLGNGEFKRKLTLTEFNKEIGIFNLVRNVVFEPTDDNPYDSIEHALNQIEVAFNCNRPANISSHRVNFCGLLDESNRLEGLKSLKSLITRIITKWPDAEFISASELVSIMEETK